MNFRLRLPLAFAVGLLLSGCAITDEFSRQGGFTDRILDEVLFAAETREHRVFRSYLLVGILARIGSESPVNLDDREAVGFRIGQAVQASKEALICAQDDDCAFFEDRQALLDRRLFRLAVAVLYPEETRDLLAKIRDSLKGEVPVAGRAVKMASAAIEVVGEAGGTVNEAAGIVNSLLSLSFTTMQYSQRLGPIYRDSIELDMKIFRASVGKEIGDRKRPCATSMNGEDSGKLNVTVTSTPIPPRDTDICDLQSRVKHVYGNGIGNVWAWRTFLNGEAKPYAQMIKPLTQHWVQASDLVARGCMLLLKEDKRSLCYDKGSLIYDRELGILNTKHDALKAALN